MNRPEHIWVFNINSRNYTHPDGTKSRSPIWKDHWVKRRVVGETSRSWVLGTGTKIPKKNPGPGVAFSQEEVDCLAWCNDHSRHIAELVRRCDDIVKLEEIAEIMGYESDG